MSRRISTYIYQKGRRKDEVWNPLAPSYGRFRIDEGNTNKKECRVALGKCKDQEEAESRLHKKMQEIGVLPVEEQVSASVQAQTPSFRTQAEWYIEQLKTGGIVNKITGVPVASSTISIYQTGINYLNSKFIGGLPLTAIGNAEAKRLVKLMMEDQRSGRFSDSCKTVREYFAVMQMVIASAVDQTTGKRSHHHHLRHIMAAD